MVTVAVAHDYSYEQWFVVGIYQNMQKAEDHYTQLLNDKPVSRMDGKVRFWEPSAKITTLAPSRWLYGRQINGTCSLVIFEMPLDMDFTKYFRENFLEDMIDVSQKLYIATKALGLSGEEEESIPVPDNVAKALGLSGEEEESIPMPDDVAKALGLLKTASTPEPTPARDSLGRTDAQIRAFKLQFLADMKAAESLPKDERDQRTTELLRKNLAFHHGQE